MNGLRTLLSSSAVAVLFLTASAGLWISPSDISTLYQDSLGTTPVTAYGQPVGLALDKSKSMALGPELISGSWTLTVAGTATATESPAGTLNLTGDGTNQAIADMSIATVIGATYKVTALSSVPAAILISANQGGGGTVLSTTFQAGSNTATFVATSPTMWIRFFKTLATLAVITTISARQVTHLGSERITNGAFPTDLSGWTQANTGASTVTWSAGAALFNTNGIDKARLQQSFPTVVGETYLVSAGGTGVACSIGTSAGVQNVVSGLNNNVRPTFTFVATTTTTWFNTDTTTNGATLDNISVRQIIRDGSEMNSILPWTLSFAGTATATESPTGTLNLTGDGTNSAKADKAFSTVPGASYRITAAVSTQPVSIMVGTAQGLQDVVAQAGYLVGTATFQFTATSTTSWIRFFRVGAALGVASAISVKLVAGAHASQPTSTKRPIYGQWPAQKARNLAQYSSDLSNAWWIKSAGASVAAAGVNTPLGNPAWTITYSAIDITALVQSAARTVVAGETYTFSCWILAGTAPSVNIRFGDPAGGAAIGSVPVTPTASWVRYSTTLTMPTSGVSGRVEIRGSSVTAGTVIVGDIQWELASTASAYQKQTAAGVYSDPLYRNLANGSADVGNATYWPASSNFNGVTATKGASGVGSDGLPFVEYTVSGTSSAASVITLPTPQRVTASMGIQFNASLIVSIVAGTPPVTANQSGIRVGIVGESVPGTNTESFISTLIAPTVDTLATITGQLAAAGSVLAYGGIQIRTNTGDTVNYTVRIKALQFELGTERTAYQANKSRYEVTEAGLPSVAGLWFDGVDDFLQTPTITPGTDKGQIFAGLRKLSDAVRGIVATQQGAASRLSLEAPGVALNNYSATAGGSTLTGANSGAIPAPTASVITVLDDISGVTLALRSNGSQVASSGATQGTGNYAAGQVTIGTNSGGTQPFNGVLNELVMRFGATLDTSLIVGAEQAVNAKTYAYG